MLTERSSLYIAYIVILSQALGPHQPRRHVQQLHTNLDALTLRNLNFNGLASWRKKLVDHITKCSLAQGLCGVPDVPHIQLQNHNKPQETELFEASGRGGSVRITFELKLTEQTEAIWDTVLIGKRLYIQVRPSFFPDGSKEAFITLLEYAEEVLKCTDIIVCLKKDRPDRPQLVRTFMYLGFSILPPGHELLPHNNDTLNLYMRHAIV